jgi:hypothetical protein
MHRLAWMFVAAIGTVLAFAFPATSMSPSAGNRVVLTEKGRGYPGSVNGRFTLTGAGEDSGTSHLFGSERSVRYVDGQRQQRGAGGGAYEGKRGSFDVTWEGTSVGLNALVSVLSGTWRITDGTGVYKAWKGGGRFVVVEREPSAGLNTYEARWEGLVRR